MPTVRRQSELAIVRDTAVQKLRDLTVAVALASLAAVAIIAWISAASIPGAGGLQGQTGNTANDGGQPVTENDDGFIQGPPPATTGSGPGIVVTGGSHP